MPLKSLILIRCACTTYGGETIDRNTEIIEQNIKSGIIKKCDDSC